MKHHLESRQVFSRIAELRQDGVRAALATILRVRGSAYRHEGAKLLVAEDGSTVGNVSGGCLELDVREVAHRVIARGVPEFREYCSGSEEVAAWDLGLGCEGEVELLVEPVHELPVDLLPYFDGDEPFVLCEVVPSDTGRQLVVTARTTAGHIGSAELDAAVTMRARQLLTDGASPGVHEVMARKVFFDLFAPPPHLMVIGAGDDARPLVAMALGVGFRVTVVDRRPALLVAERFPAGTRLVEENALPAAAGVPARDHFAVIMNHHYADDERWLRTLLATEVGYIGVLGPRQRTDRMLSRLGDGEPVEDPRVHGPIGLDIGTDGAEQVALAVLAEIMAVRSGRAAQSLRERTSPIHAPEG
jgi:xanthine dehydrogenase accessory factor